MSEKQFKKKAKKLVEPRDYIICDGTDDDTGSLTKFSNVVSMSGFNPPSKLLKVRIDEDFDCGIDVDKVKKMERKYFKNNTFKSSAMACVKGMLNERSGGGQINMFVILRNKAYKVYGKKIQKKVIKLIGADFDFVYLFDDVEEDKKLLRKELSRDKLKYIRRRLAKLEKSLTSDKDDD